LRRYQRTAATITSARERTAANADGEAQSDKTEPETSPIDRASIFRSANATEPHHLSGYLPVGARLVDLQSRGVVEGLLFADP
jgi:hypothetical protein